MVRLHVSLYIMSVSLVLVILLTPLSNAFAKYDISNGDHNVSTDVSSSKNDTADETAYGDDNKGNVAVTDNHEKDFHVKIIDDGKAVEITRYTGIKTAVLIPSTVHSLPVTIIGKEAFREKKLVSVTIPHGIMTIEERAFANNQLSSVIIPDSVVYIERGAFAYNQLTSVTIPYGVTFIGIAAFAENKLTDITIPYSMTSIENGVFAYNQLTGVTIPDGIISIGNGAFANNQLTDVIIPYSVTFIGKEAFANNQLSDITIPNRMAFISEEAFANNLFSDDANAQGSEVHATNAATRTPAITASDDDGSSGTVFTILLIMLCIACVFRKKMLHWWHVIKIRKLVKQHSQTLLIKKRQSLYEDAYGVLVADDWIKELNYFIGRVVAPALNIRCDKTMLSLYRPIIMRILVDIEGESGKTYTPKPSLPPTGYDYEKEICSRLKRLGFNARTTKVSGDQGVDVLAIKNGVSFAIQCKLYSQPVGNKAVQEVNSGREVYGTDYGVVVSNASFTKSAHQLV